MDIMTELSHPTTKPNSPDDRLLWVDCEFTGLSEKDDVILEVAAVATDYRLRELADYSAFVQHDEAEVRTLAARDDWWLERPEHLALMASSSQNLGKPLEVVGSELAQFTSEWVGDQDVVLAGNTIYTDRKFLVRDFNELASKLQYRMLDVSGIKLIARALLGEEYKKRETHQATEDIRESLEELRFLLNLIGNSDIRAAIQPGTKIQSADLRLDPDQSQWPDISR